MIESLFITLLGISLTTGVVILILKLSSGMFNKTFTAKWKYWIWLVLALRLIIPFDFSFPTSPVTVHIPNMSMSTFINTIPVPMQQDTTNTIQVSPPTEQVMTNTALLATEETSFTLINILIWIWIIGAALFLVYQFIGYLLFKHKALRWSKESTDGRIIQTFRQIAADMGVKQEIPLLISKSVSSPLMTGFFKPLLFLPHESYSDTDLNFILRHELTHYKRHDLWYKLFLVMVSAVHWFNPMMYVMLREANTDLELSCDDQVITGLSNDERRMYSETILASIIAQKSQQTIFSTNFYGGQKTLKTRFLNIFNTKKKRNGAVALLTVILAISILGSLITSKVDIGENKLLTKLGYTEVLLTDILDHKTTFSSNNEHINQIIKLLPQQDQSVFKTFTVDDELLKEINYVYEFEGTKNAGDPFYGMVWEYDALLLFASIEGLEKVNFVHYLDQTRFYETISYTADDVAARFGISNPSHLRFSDLYNVLASNILLSEDYFGHPARLTLGSSINNTLDYYGQPNEIWPQSDGSTVMVYTENDVFAPKLPDSYLDEGPGFIAMYYVNSPIAEKNDKLTDLYVIRYAFYGFHGQDYSYITEQFGMPTTVKRMNNGDKFIAYPLREGQQRHAYFIFHNNKVVEEGLMYGSDYTILDFEQKTAASGVSNV